MHKRPPNTAHTAAAGPEARAARAAGNAFDWLFRPHRLFRADRTPYRVIHRQGIASVRYYPPLPGRPAAAGGQSPDLAARQYPVPVVLIPPLAANTFIFDLLPERSLVRYLLAQGFAVYLVDWGEPGRDDAHLGLRDYVLDMLPAALAQVRRHSGRPRLSLFGHCLGGLFALLYAGSTDDDIIRNIVTVASPVDMHNATPAARALPRLDTPVRLLRQHKAFRIHDLDPRLLHMPGPINALAFKLTAPASHVTAYRHLLTRLADRNYVAAHSTTRRWLNAMLDVPGALLQDILVQLLIDNDLADGRTRIGESESDLHRIDCPLLAIAGDNDALASAASVHRLLDLIASGDKRFAVTPGGHVGVFAGPAAPDNSWPLAAGWLAERSRT